MAVSAKLYGLPLLAQWGTTPINWTADTIKVALCTNAYTPNQDTHAFFSDITNELTTAGGYTAGGATLGSAAKTYTAGTNVLMFDGADTSWASSTITARYAIVYKSTGTGSTSPLVLYVDFGADVSTTNGTFQITWDAAGLWTITVA